MPAPDTRFSLIGRLHNGHDTEAWNEFIQLYQPLIFRIARRRGLQHADAAEVTQEVLSRISQAIKTWEPDPKKGSFRGWLHRITRNMTIDFLRRGGKHAKNINSNSRFEIDLIADASQDDSREFQMEFERQLFNWAAKRIRGRFAESSWQAFWQTAIEEKSAKQVATELSISVGAVYVARSRIMKQLAEEVKLRSDESLG